MGRCSADFRLCFVPNPSTVLVLRSVNFRPNWAPQPTKLATLARVRTYQRRAWGVSTSRATESEVFCLARTMTGSESSKKRMATACTRVLRSNTCLLDSRENTREPEATHVPEINAAGFVWVVWPGDSGGDKKATRSCKAHLVCIMAKLYTGVMRRVVIRMATACKIQLRSKHVVARFTRKHKGAEPEATRSKRCLVCLGCLARRPRGVTRKPQSHAKHTCCASLQSCTRASRGLTSTSVPAHHGCQ